MKYACNTVVLTPEKPVKQMGHSCQTEPVNKVHDDLHGRIIALENEERLFISVSCDLLGFSYDFSEEINREVSGWFDKPVKVAISCTHNHYGGYTYDPAFRQQCRNAILTGIRQLDMKEGNLTATYKSTPYKGVGNSRISNHEAFVLLNLIQIYDGEREIIDIINYNCHPTVLSAEKTDFFSAEYVGNALAKLTKGTDTYFTFLQGAAGDISTRFTRSGQDYQAVDEMGSRFVEKVQELRDLPAEKKKLTLDFQEEKVAITYDLNDPDISLLPDNLSARELETIEKGKVARKNLIAAPEKWQKDMTITQLDLGVVKILFAPNELFSYYLRLLDTSKAFLACYTNGYSPYVLPLGEFIFTYEAFTDLLSAETKQRLIDLLKKYN